MVSWLPMPRCVKYSPRWEWGHHRAHVHAGPVAILIYKRSYAAASINFCLIRKLFLLMCAFFVIRLMRLQHWLQRGTFGHWDTLLAWKMEVLWYWEKSMPWFECSGKCCDTFEVVAYILRLVNMIMGLDVFYAYAYILQILNDYFVLRFQNNFNVLKLLCWQICERSLTSSTGGPTGPPPSNFVRAEMLPSGFLIRPCEGGGSIIHIVDHIDLDVRDTCNSNWFYNLHYIRAIQPSVS